MANNKITVTTTPREVILTRTFDAPRELVFDAFTRKEHLEKWFGPHGFSTTAETDPRPGGKYRITMYATDALPPEFAGDYPMFGVYKEFVRPERIVFTSDLTGHSDTWKAQISAACGSDGYDTYHSATEIVFEDLGDGRTKITLRAMFATDAIRDGYVKTGMNEGWEQCFERLDVLLASR